MKIDMKDRRILTELDMNARLPMTQLAKRVGLSRQVVEYRIKRMQKHGLVHGAIAIFDSVVVGQKWFRVVFRLLNASQEEKNEFIAYLTKHDHVLWLGEVGGNYDLVVNMVCRDTFEFNKLFETIISDHGDKILDYSILVYIDVYDGDRSYLLPECKNERKFFYHKMRENPNIKLDALDKKIIKVIAKDAMITNVALGAQLGVAANTIKNRIDAMKKSGLLLGFRLMINPQALGFMSHMLFLEIGKLNVEREKQLYNYLKAIPNISFVVKHIGSWRIGMEVETKDAQEFQNIFVAIRGEFHDIINDFKIFPLFRDHQLNYFPDGCLK